MNLGEIPRDGYNSSVIRTITIEVDDFVYEWAERLAAESGAPVEYHVMELLVKYGRKLAA